MLRAFRLTLFLAVATATGAAMAQNERIDYRFKGGADGAGPVGGLVAADQNTLYGTTSQGGTHFMGTVFSLIRVGNTWTHKVLYSFAGGSDGAFPQGDLIISGGILYGTTTSGGVSTAICESGCGTVFSLTPNAAKTAWTEKIIHRFAGGGNGREPRAGVIVNGGSLFGTTYGGGVGSGFGIVYRLTPNQAKTVWSKSILYAFKGGLDGGNPEAKVVFVNGILYGLTTREGIKTGQCSQDSRGCGTAFQLKSPTSGQAPWAHTVLYRFKGSNDGMEPSGPLTVRNGVYFGTTHRGGAANKGTVFSLTPNTAHTVWTEKVIYPFKAGVDGKDPQGVVFHGSDLVGLTATDGTAKGAGILYSLSPAGVNWSFLQLHRFTSNPDGESPEGQLLFSAGVGYGVTFSGGIPAGDGTVFEAFRPQ